MPRGKSTRTQTRFEAAYSWKTEALADALPANGQLGGNLYLRGSGDPRLALEHFWQLLRQLRARGVARISGDVILDRCAFALPPYDPAEFDNEPLRPYNAGPDALLVNLASVRLTWTLTEERGGVTTRTQEDKLWLFLPFSDPAGLSARLQRALSDQTVAAAPSALQARIRHLQMPQDLRAGDSAAALMERLLDQA